MWQKDCSLLLVPFWWDTFPNGISCFTFWLHWLWCFEMLPKSVWFLALFSVCCFYTIHPSGPNFITANILFYPSQFPKKKLRQDPIWRKTSYVKKINTKTFFFQVSRIRWAFRRFGPQSSTAWLLPASALPRTRRVGRFNCSRSISSIQTPSSDPWWTSCGRTRWFRWRNITRRTRCNVATICPWVLRPISCRWRSVTSSFAAISSIFSTNPGSWSRTCWEIGRGMLNGVSEIFLESFFFRQIESGHHFFPFLPWNITPPCRKCVKLCLKSYFPLNWVISVFFTFFGV